MCSDLALPIHLVQSVKKFGETSNVYINSHAAMKCVKERVRDGEREHMPF